jgi:hypothetical protein
MTADTFFVGGLSDYQVFKERPAAQRADRFECIKQDALSVVCTWLTQLE